MDPISILIADDHPLILAGLSSLLGAMPEFRLVAQAADGVQAVALYQQHRPDVAILDLSMPRLNGVEAIEQIRAFDDSASIVILTTYQGDEDVYRGLRAGAKAYLLKDGGSDQLLDCIRTVASGQQFLPAAVASKLAQRKAASQLSRRELEILTHLATGKSNKMIARSADIEVGTVKFHVNNILAKLNVASRTEAATVAARRGLLSVF
ncbi:DNA-binding response regulator, NarL/FixJ family, contains REC and HTH domains [Duganella sacchari]|uniref:DNA-binding response regulator, NarL/FixJ family, contains REC and HTH domains n=1 Tax=Duganella sacchari TaxID=551987 RepID=A0A1M7NY89_9BURK|nr:response regulator transcription factor [Duganella sacchari]SHN09211.1 DNA-binding response regulator, NarL/FixJ family, contains REC and HTH domains [Duganella sacchari]